MIIFFLNVGKSGSMAVARGFNLEHEPDGYSPDVGQAKIRSNKNKEFYGETNHFWKSKIDKLQAGFPEAVFIHLIRNGKETTRSFFYTSNHYRYLTNSNEPAYRNETLPITDFEKMSRFEKLCWYWRYWNEEIEKRVKSRIKLEDLHIPKVNVSYNSFDKVWTPEMEKTFEGICGELNRKYGYEC